jgi:predicted NAD-dependent protein-ADP-ribosyltransferase YbiA (DUF1768 family)
MKLGPRVAAALENLHEFKNQSDAPRIVPADNRILYFCRDRVAFGFLSHFHASPIVLDGETWPTLEHITKVRNPTISRRR